MTLPICGLLTRTAAISSSLLRAQFAAVELE
jgi:hypothetical protein